MFGLQVHFFIEIVSCLGANRVAEFFDLGIRENLKTIARIDGSGFGAMIDSAATQLVGHGRRGGGLEDLSEKVRTV